MKITVFFRLASGLASLLIAATPAAATLHVRAQTLSVEDVYLDTPEADSNGSDILSGGGLNGAESVASPGGFYISSAAGEADESGIPFEAWEDSDDAQERLDETGNIDLSNLQPITDAVMISYKLGDENKRNILEAEIPSDTQLAALACKDGEYEFVEISFDEGKAEVNLPSDASVRFFRTEKSEPLQSFIPSYLNSDFTRYQAAKLSGEGEIYDGWIPDTVMLYGGSGSGNFFDSLQSPKAIDLNNPYDNSLPESFDQRGRSYMSEVKDQKNTNLCWAFSSLGAVETLLGKKFSFSIDLSVANAAYKLSSNASGFKRGLTDSGNFNMSAAYMSGTSGPVLESADPFEGIFTGSVGAKAESVANVLDFETLNYNISVLKEKIMNYGCVVSAMYTDDRQTGFNLNTSAYYMADPSVIPNHIVQLVGWDNNYPAGNFASKPPLDGAWIAKNSWGEEYGDNGYNYISYADYTISKTLNVVTRAETPSADETLYSYDPYGQVGSINFNTKSAWAANIFTLNNPGERLSAVSFYCANTSADYEIWLGSGISLSERTKIKSGRALNAGYVTAVLDQPINLTNANFTVFVKLYSDSVVCLPIEKNLDKYLSSAESMPGQSFASKDGVNWEDVGAKIPNANLCVRAWTKSKEAASKTNAPYEASVLKQAAQGSNAFSDLPAATPYATYAEAAEAIVKAAGLGSASEAMSILRGLSCYDMAGDFSPQSPITREEFCYELAMAANLPKAAGKSMSDISGSYARSAIISLYVKKIVSPNPDGNFYPAGKLTKSDMNGWLAKVKELIAV
ncbi:MAG: lectin like domain-containing protein [Clostridiales bacterium]|nr:lectin like domain-containing protein [Clostridiales bacterium]